MISPDFSILCEPAFILIALHSVHPPQSGPFSRSLLSRQCHLLSNILLIAWPYQEICLFVMYVVVALTIAFLLNISFWSFLVPNILLPTFDETYTVRNVLVKKWHLLCTRFEMCIFVVDSCFRRQIPLYHR